MGTNTGIGIGIGIPFKNNVLGEGKPYLPPEIKDSLKAVVIAYGKTNNDSDRAIVKNLVDASNPFIISNAAFKLNSGFGKYSADFESFDWAVNISQKQHNKATISLNGRLCNHTAIEVDEMKVNIIGNVTELIYWYIANPDDTTRSEIRLTSGINTLPKSYAKDDGQTYNIGFAYISGDSEITIEQIPSFEGAFVTDGVNDLITSAKSATEMLDGSNEITVVSMIHQIKTNSDVTRNNWFFTPVSYLENRVVENKTGKTGIYGYTSTNVTNAQISDITPILGDKNDYTLYSKIEDGDRDYFTVEGLQNQGIWYVSSIAWYWTIIANKVLTTDQINQVIAYFNLDRTLNPDILCDVKKQGITNENHAEFGDKLIDFSGNGRDIQLNNLAWKGGSGIAAKQYETFKDWTNTPYQTSTVTEIDEFTRVVDSTSNSYWVSMINRTSDFDKVHDSINIVLYQDDMLLVHECKYKIDENVTTKALYETLKSGVNTITLATIDKFTDIPEDAEIMSLGEWVNPKSNKGSVKITLLPSYKGGLLLDGVNDFGKVTGMPIYKDYTVVADREIVDGLAASADGGVALKGNKYLTGAFVFDYKDSCWSFGGPKMIPLNTKRFISYQSKYVSNGISVDVGTATDNDELWIGKLGNEERYSKLAIRFLMSFPYSMSEFLIERQLKKYKLGTLYPNMVEFRPVIKANANYKITYYQIDSTNTWKSIKVGDYIVIGAKLAFQITFDNDASELKEVVSPQLSGIIVEKRPSNPGYNIYSYITSKSPQKINITIDEYIRFEDIVQPYPILLRFNDENGNEVSWGGKFRVGSTITRIGSIADPESNLLNGLYSISGLSLNGKAVTSSTSIVEKQMVFRTTATWLLDNNEPKVILSPRLLRIPNSSYKILGHIPDISGHGNHGVIHNSAYAEMSGANGYPYDYRNSSFWCDSVLAKVVSGELIEYFAVKNSTGFSNITSGVYKGEIKVTGVTKAISENKISRLRIYTNSTTDNELIDITQDGNYNIDIKGVGDANRVFFYAISNPNSIVVRLTEPIYIEQVGEYEGAYCLDGVDDFVTIPTIVGGKQVLMKVNWQKEDTMIYNQNPGKDNFAIYANDYNNNNLVNAYASRNNGSTYIDGILNNNILATQLKDVTHNITITNENVIDNTIIPVIGANAVHNNFYAQMSLYDFMLFDEISTDDKIKELNEYVGIEAKVELPPYYWDTYGKTNSDADRDTIQQRGVAVGDYDLINYNHAYEGMSGYNGYPVVFGANKTWETFSSVYGYISDVTSTTIHVTMAKNAGTGLLFSYVKKDGALTNIKEIPAFRVTVKGLEGNSKFGYRYLATEDATEETLVYLGNGTHELAKSFAPTEALLDLTSNAWVGIFITPMVEDEAVFDCDITIEVLPEYKNGLVYDAITDYSKNANIPALDDFTAIIKREWLKKQGCPLIKGSKVYEGGNGNALLLEWDKAYNFVFYKRTDIMEGELPDNISFITPTNYNGNVITRGSEQDTNGICIAGDGNAGFANMVFYKLILYPKTIPLLQINFLKNLMERDEIIDLNNPIFIKNE